MTSTTTSFPPEKVEYRLEYNPQEVEDQTKGESSSAWKVEQTFDAPPGPPPPSYDESSAHYEPKENQAGPVVEPGFIDPASKRIHNSDSPYSQGYPYQAQYPAGSTETRSPGMAYPSTQNPYPPMPVATPPMSAVSYPVGPSLLGNPSPYALRMGLLSSARGQRGGLGGLGGLAELAGLGGPRTFAAGTTPSQLLNPPPPSFSRQPPGNLPYSAFPPCALLSISNRLEDGFPALPPPTQVQPHPFAAHDVNEEDWRVFLGHVKVAEDSSSSSFSESLMAGMSPSFGRSRGGLLPILASGIEGLMKKKKHGPVAEIIDQWNHYFFHPRMMEITLAQGQVTYSGFGDGLPPDIREYRGNQPIRVQSVSGGSIIDDLSESDSDGGKRPERRERRMERRERKAERKECRSQKRARRKGSTNEHWRLILAFKPPVL